MCLGWYGERTCINDLHRDIDIIWIGVPNFLKNIWVNYSEIPRLLYWLFFTLSRYHNAENIGPKSTMVRGLFFVVCICNSSLFNIWSIIHYRVFSLTVIRSLHTWMYAIIFLKRFWLYILHTEGYWVLEEKRIKNNFI